MSDAESQKVAQPSTRYPYRPRIRRWLPLTAALALIGLLYFLDGALKTSEFAGFAPRDATLVVASDDLARAWDALESTDAHGRVMDEAPLFFYNVVMEGRKASGIRWTPQRWGLWFGKRFVLARLEGQPGVCLRPGILTRAAALMLRVAASQTVEKGVYQTAGLAYGWRDGFLIVSPSTAYVRAAQADGAEKIELSGRPDTVSVDWRGEPSWRLTLQFSPTFSIDGWIDIEVPKRDAPLTLAGVWPESPLLEVTGTSAEEIIELVAGFVPEFPGTELVQRAFDELKGELPEDWAAGSDEFSFAIMSIDTSEFLAVPEFAMAVRGQRDLVQIKPPRGSIRHEWAGLSGWFKPWLGEKMSVCVASAEDLRLFTSSERTMAQCLGRLEEGRATESDLHVAFDLTHFASIALVLTRRAAEYELIPHHNADDAEARIVPLLDTAAQLGTLYIDGKAGDGGMYVSARLAAPRDAPSTAGSGT
ncbi:MAG: hypothetical protein IID09_00030 [Candidatus Hydrogenedentes bacterium]|nr:hypothetical protein [Candidatus Hydrogenedentota bacterium]